MSGVIKGIPAGKQPITYIPGKNVFAVVSTAYNAYHLELFDAITGKLNNSYTIEGNDGWVPYKMLQVSDNGLLRLLASKQVVALQLK